MPKSRRNNSNSIVGSVLENSGAFKQNLLMNEDILDYSVNSNLSANAPNYVPVNSNLSANAPEYIPGGNLNPEGNTFVPTLNPYANEYVPSMNGAGRRRKASRKAPKTQRKARKAPKARKTQRKSRKASRKALKARK